VLTLYIIPSLFSIVDDIRKKRGRLDVEGEDQPSMACTFTEGWTENRSAERTGSGGPDVTQSSSSTGEHGGDAPDGGGA
jgi:hypothetical protein